MELGISGLASNFDWRSLVEQLSDLERTPQQRLRAEQTQLGERNNAYGSIETQLGVLRNKITTLKEQSLFDSRTTSVADKDIASASAASGATNGAFLFDFVQLATSAEQRGAADMGAGLSATNNVSALVLANAGFSTAVTAGTFSVNGKQVTLATTDTLQQVFDNISTATGGSVTASYDSTTDKITLSSASTIVLGTATDTSNFLAVTRLYNNGGASIASAVALGGAKLFSSLTSSNLRTAISDGGSGAGAFKVNGVSIPFNASTDTLSSVLESINDSAAGVNASYDSVNDRFILRNKSTGDVGVALEDVTGNFLAATGLTSGTLQRGKNLLYTVNGGNQLISVSNTITDASSGVTGLTVTALQEDTTTVTVASDRATVKKAITEFIDEYNRAQTLIDGQTASATDGKGKVTAGVLASENDATAIAAKLRSLSYSEVTGLSTSLTLLASLGINTNGTDDQLAIADPAKLDAALDTNLTAVRELFTNASTGIAVRLDDYLEKTIGDDGTLNARQDNLTKTSGAIDTQIADLERIVLSNRQRLIDSFVAMETAQQKINQQMEYLTRNFPS